MKYSRRHAVWSVISTGISALQPSLGDEIKRSKPVSLPKHLTPETYAAIEQGVDWLISRQQADGGFGESHSYSRNVGVCALCGMAFLSHGSRRQLGTQIKKCTNYLIAHARSNGFIVEDHVVTHAPMYGHGFATMYLGQVYGADHRLVLRETLKRAVALIATSQNDQGAWRYTTHPDDADVSVTTCQMMALLSAQQAGIAVSRNVIKRSVDFLLRCQNPDGGFRYRLIDPPDSLFPRSAAAVVALHAAGLHFDDSVLKGRQYLAIPAPTPAPKQAEYYYYGRYYAAHAAWQAGDAAWDKWYPPHRDELLQRQSADGRWTDPNAGDEYATAMSLIVLQFPFNNVPLFLL